MEGGDEFGAAAGSVEIVVAQEEFTAGGSGALGGDPEGAGVTEMQVSGGGWREAAAVGRRALFNHSWF